mmetsp:Transcript_2791/g.4219  ORF Transcript_2791/g.4219 Transcript_2791/m.4219 type:complete len:87 (-) Transcript_2791:58-318(-)
MKFDAAIKEVLPSMQQQPGYVRTSRTVCKAEWAYELDIQFDSLDNFKAYMDGDFRKTVALPVLEKLKPLMTEPDKVYSGNRVSDDL